MNMGHPEGESMRMGFEGGIKLEFHGAKVTSGGGRLAHRELDDALGLFDVCRWGLPRSWTSMPSRHWVYSLAIPWWDSSKEQ